MYLQTCYVPANVLCTCKRVMYLHTCYVPPHVLCTCKRVMYLHMCYVPANVLCTCKRVMYLQTCYVPAHVLCTCTRVMYLHTCYVPAHVLCTCTRVLYLHMCERNGNAWRKKAPGPPGNDVFVCTGVLARPISPQLWIQWNFGTNFTSLCESRPGALAPSLKRYRWARNTPQ